jgi:hypothetical protein
MLSGRSVNDLDYDSLIKGIKDIGFPMAVSAWVLYLYTSNGKDFTSQLSKLNEAFRTLIQSNKDSIDDLVKQNNFMIHAMTNLIGGHEDAAKDILNQAIIEKDDEEDKVVKGGGNK